MSTDPLVARIRDRIAALEALVAQWKTENDPDARWSLYLLTEAIELERTTLRHHVRDPDPMTHSQGGPS